MSNDKSKALHFISQVSEEFILYKTAIHRRPVHRSPLGDIHLSVECLTMFLYSYFNEDGISDEDLAMKFFLMLDIYTIKHTNCIASLGSHEGLKRGAVAEIEDVLDFFAERVCGGDYADSSVTG